MASPLVLLDSDTLSEIMKGRDLKVIHRAEEYVREHHSLQFSIVTRFEILRGLRAKGAPRQIATFLDRCLVSVVYPLTEN